MVSVVRGKFFGKICNETGKQKTAIWGPHGGWTSSVPRLTLLVHRAPDGTSDLCVYVKQGRTRNLRSDTK